EIPERSASLDSMPGSVRGSGRCPACWRAGTIWSHDEPSSQKPGIRMIFTVPTLVSGPVSSYLNSHADVAEVAREQVDRRRLPRPAGGPRQGRDSEERNAAPSNQQR